MIYMCFRDRRWSLLAYRIVFTKWKGGLGWLRQSMDPSRVMLESLKGLESWHCSLLFLLPCADTACAPPEVTATGAVLGGSIGLQTWEKSSCCCFVCLSFTDYTVCGMVLQRSITSRMHTSILNIIMYLNIYVYNGRRLVGLAYW